MKKMIILPILLIASCGSVEEDGADVLRVLFVGNSLTYYNDLPAMVARMAEVAADRELEYETVAFANFSLEDHWGDGTARTRLEDGSWDFVVMQQGPSSLPENQENLRTWTEKFADEARSHGTEPALFTVWPSRSRLFAIGDVIGAYAAAAAAVDGKLLPAGEAWQEAWAADASLELYGPDEFHPSQMGSYLAALVIFGGLFEIDPRSVPSSLRISGGEIVEIPDATASLLQRSARTVLSRTERSH